jgi:hypothetical protein
MSLVEGVKITDVKLGVTVKDGVWHGSVEGTLDLAGDDVIGAELSAAATTHVNASFAYTEGKQVGMSGV